MLVTILKWTLGTLFVGWGWHKHLKEKQQEWQAQREWHEQLTKDEREWQEQLTKDEAERFKQEMEDLALQYHGKPFGELNGAQQQAIFLEVYRR